MSFQSTPDIFKNAAELNLDGFDDAEFSRLNVEAHPLCYDVQDALADLLDMDEIFIKGGAIRNVLSGHEVDEIDAIFDVTQSNLVSRTFDVDIDDPQDMLEYVARIINTSEDFEDCIIKYEGNAGEEPVINMMAKYKGMDIDLNLVTHPVDKWTLVHECSAPILSAIMDPNGDCWAAPDFQDHLDAKIIVTDNPDKQEKFQKEGGKCDKYSWQCMDSNTARQHLENLRAARDAPQYDTP